MVHQFIAQNVLKSGKEKIMLRLPELLQLKEYKRKYRITPKFYHIIAWKVAVILLIILCTSQNERLALYYADMVVPK